MLSMAQDKRHFGWLAALLLLGAFIISGCGGDTPPQTRVEDASPSVTRAQTIVIGDVDPDEPSKKIARFQPLANYLSQNLEEFGIQIGKVIIAQNIDQMGQFLKEGDVDIYFDSPFPALVVQDIAESKFLLRRTKEGVSAYWSTYVSLGSKGFKEPKDFLGKIIAFEEPRSTSGFILPAGNLIAQGFKLKEVDGPTVQVSSDEIGYFFSSDEENTIELVLQGLVAGGGISNQDYDELPQELMEKLTSFGQTITVPRQIVSVRPALDPGLQNRIRQLLLGLKDTEEGRLILEEMKDSSFDPLPPGTDAVMEELRELIQLVAPK